MTHTTATQGIVVFPGPPTTARGLIWARLSPIGQENRWRRIISYLLCQFSSALMSCLPPAIPERASAILCTADRTHPHHHPTTPKTQGLAISQSLQLSQESVSPPPASLRSLPPSYLYPPQSAFQHDKPHGISAVL